MENADAYIDSMISGERIHYFNYHRTWERDNDYDRAIVVRMFMAIKDIVVYKKLSDDKDQGFANGAELVKAMDPSFNSYASYWLQRPGHAIVIKQLVSAGLIDKRTRSQAPYGYGDDEQFWLTPLAMVLINKGRTKDIIKLGVRNIVLDKTSRDIWHLDRYGESL